LKDLDKVDVLEPNNAFTLRSRADVKMMLEDCQKALEDLDKVDVPKPNNIFILQCYVNVKRILKDY
jgi:chaperonin cofactor prefoldin